ncbi:MAG: hypothetical protein HZC46_10435 [Ignavibacterium album]|uniref:hypothetical protein n=1 Tax=Ignavibacterium album TaxID=591197 RepID=UPI0026F01562|nr:hypothetical protein [Ignavibacterium album]MBI5662550.1 hypothetical protein [Ignavibacterium album]
MKLEDLLNIEKLAEYYILSNTPYFLFKKFSNEDSIKVMSEKFTTNELIELFKQKYLSELKSIEEVVMLYSILISMIFKPYEEVKNFMSEVPKYNFRWSKQISEIFFSKKISENVSFINMNYKTLSTLKSNSSGTSDDKIEYKVKPKIILEEK